MSSSAAADLGPKIASLHARIAKERKIAEGFQAMRSATTNQDVIRTCEAKMRESAKTIGWFEDSLRELEGRVGGGGASASASASASATGSTTGGRASPASHAHAMADARAGGGGGGGGNGGQDRMNRQLPPPPPGAAPSYQQQQPHYGALQQQQRDGSSEQTLAPKVTYTSLDLIKADTPLTSAKISRMLHQLEFKLHVERQYKEGIDKMAKLYLVDGDKKARAETESKRVESRQKMVLLSQALKRYKTLDVMGELGEEDDGIPEDIRANIRKPLSGTLQITIKSARDLAHAPQPKKSKYPSETVIYVKVEDTPRARTHPSRSDRWNEEFELSVDKANEVEVTIYDKVPGEGAPVPIGMLWLRLSDIVEELRRRKMGAEAGPGWVTAAKVNSHQHSASNSLGGVGASANFGGPNDHQLVTRQPSHVGGPGDSTTGGQDGVDAWFAVEPEGAIMLHLNFVKTNVRKRPYDAGGLGRQGAVRKRKEEVHEQNGHQFVQKQFYTVVMCALCGEFMLKGAGMQCEDCKYACHVKCYQKVVTKCISKSNADSEKDEEQINHRIPHRFEPITNISPNWCCHCGMVLPLGRKQARKCSEPNCGITAHADCVHLVPDFCGMSMLMANQLLSDIKKINDSKAGRKPHSNVRPVKPPTTPQQVRPMPPTDRIRTDVYGGTDGYDGNRMPQHTYASRPAPTSELAGEVGRMNLQPSNSRIPPPPQNVDQELVGGQQSPYRQQQQQQPGVPYHHPVIPPPRQSSAATSASAYSNDSRYASPVEASYSSAQAQGPPYSAPVAQAQQQMPSSASSLPSQQHAQSSFPQQPQQSSYQQQSYQQQRPMPPPPQPQQLPTAPSQSYQLPSQSQQQRMSDPRAMQQQQQQQQQQQAPPSQQQQPLPPLAIPQGQPQPSAQALQQQQYLQQQAATQLQKEQQVQQMAAQQQQAQQQALAQQQAQARRAPAAKKRIGLDDFNFLAVLGKGNFGKVMLAEEKRSSQLYAIKVLKKEFIIENDEVESTKSEKRVFLTAARERHPFLLGLHSCFQTETRIYFVMEYISGGDLMLHIQREQFTPRRAKFYAAEVLLALEYFHQNGIVYRDLKLDNILLTLDGHVKVADYGLCKEDMWFGKTTGTFCGTPEFMAPEIILEQRYGRAVDWWAFGVLIYEMLLGQSPFRGDDEDEIFDAILEDEPLYPIHMPKDSVSILQKLLTRDPTRRLGSGEADAAEIKSHLFFKDTNWDDIFHKRVPSPFFPAISSATDTSNFDSEFTSEQPTLTPVHSTLSAQDQGEFAGFSWTAAWAGQ